MMGKRAASVVQAGVQKAISTPVQSPLLVQLVETLSQKIQRILQQRRIEITPQDADNYATQLQTPPRNTLIQVLGRNRALKMNNIGVVSSVEYRPPSDASNMRVSPYFGPMPQDASSMVSEGRYPITGFVMSQDIRLDAANLNDIPDREDLGRVMGGSAAILSNIPNSEWLHLVAHSLVGPDTADNLQAGPHPLNTAMIPFERAVRNMVRQGQIVNYQVTFFADTENDEQIFYVHHVEIGIQVNDQSETRYWTLNVDPNHRDQFINGQVLAEIQQIAQELQNNS
jgi:hypothetical protein